MSDTEDKKEAECWARLNALHDKFFRVLMDEEPSIQEGISAMMMALSHVCIQEKMPLPDVALLLRDTWAIMGGAEEVETITERIKATMRPARTAARRVHFAARAARSRVDDE